MVTARRRPAAETRAEILEAAEAVFADLGYAAARLEDVAERVGIRRASLVYHFRDKRELYRAVLENALGPLRTSLRRALAGGGTAPERVDAVVVSYAEYLGARPSVARLILREVADGDSERMAALLAGGTPILADWAALVRGTQRGDAARRVDPLELASMLIGACAFLYIATPYLQGEHATAPTDPARRRAQVEELRRWTRSVLASGDLRLIRNHPPGDARAKQEN